MRKTSTQENSKQASKRVREGEGRERERGEESEWLTAFEGKKKKGTRDQMNQCKNTKCYPSLPKKKPLPITLITTTTSQLSQKPFGGFGPSRHPTPVGKEAL